MFHCNGWGMPYAVTGMGGRHVVLRKVDGAEILRRVDAHGVTLMCGAPAVVAAVLDAAATWDGPIPGRGRVRIVVAGAPPPTRTIERVETELGWEFIQIYGLTETSPLLTMNRRRAEWDDLVAGRARAASSAAPARPRSACSSAIDEQGEVLARSNVVLEGYWEQPEATAEAIVDGWFHTGDGGTIDDEGYLTISDRKKDVIITGGENVSSIEVEDALFPHPAVAEVAVIGVPDEKWGETVKALVVLVPGVDRRPRPSSSSTAAAASRTTSARPASSSATSSRAPRPASCRSSSSARPTGKAAPRPGRMDRTVGACDSDPVSAVWRRGASRRARRGAGRRAAPTTPSRGRRRHGTATTTAVAGARGPRPGWLGERGRRAGRQVLGRPLLYTGSAERRVRRLDGPAAHPPGRGPRHRRPAGLGRGVARSHPTSGRSCVVVVQRRLQVG